MSTIRSRDDDHRGDRMGEQGYWDAAWERSEAEVLAERAAQPPADLGDSRRLSTLGPGIVAMSLRGDDEDVEVVVAALRGCGFKVWVSDSHATEEGNRLGYRYYSVEVPADG